MHGLACVCMHVCACMSHRRCIRVCDVVLVAVVAAPTELHLEQHGVACEGQSAQQTHQPPLHALSAHLPTRTCLSACLCNTKSTRSACKRHRACKIALTVVYKANILEPSYPHRHALDVEAADLHEDTSTHTMQPPTHATEFPLQSAWHMPRICGATCMGEWHCTCCRCAGLALTGRMAGFGRRCPTVHSLSHAHSRLVNVAFICHAWCCYNSPA